METAVLYANGVKIYQFKAKNSEIKPHQLYLGNVLDIILDLMYVHISDYEIMNLVKMLSFLV